MEWEKRKSKSESKSKREVKRQEQEQERQKYVSKLSGLAVSCGKIPIVTLIA